MRICMCIYIYIYLCRYKNTHTYTIHTFIHGLHNQERITMISKICQVAASEASQPQTEVAPLAGQRTKPWVTPFFFLNGQKSMEILKYHGNIMEIWKILKKLIMEHIMDV